MSSARLVQNCISGGHCLFVQFLLIWQLALVLSHLQSAASRSLFHRWSSVSIKIYSSDRKHRHWARLKPNFQILKHVLVKNISIQNTEVPKYWAMKYRHWNIRLWSTDFWNSNIYCPSCLLAQYSHIWKVLYWWS